MIQLMPKPVPGDATGVPSDKPPKLNLPEFLYEIEKGLLTHYSFARDPGGALWYFDGQRYAPTAADFIGQYTLKCFRQNSLAKLAWNPAHDRHILRAIYLQSPFLWEYPPPTQLNLLNGILDLRSPTPTLTSASSHWLSPIQLNVQYDPYAKCPHWDAYAHDLLPDEDPNYLYKLVAWLISSGPNNSQQAVLWLGETGGEGKSTGIKALQHLLGPQACVSRSIHSLEENRFALAGLLGKLVLVDSDVATKPLREIENFKKIVTQEEIQGEYKGGAIFGFTPRVKVIMAGNRMPLSEEGGHAWIRRWNICPFYKKLPPDKRKPPVEMHDILTHPTELSGLLNKALPFIPEVLRYGIVPTPEWKEMQENLGASHDPTEEWILSNFVYKGEAASISVDSAFEIYRQWNATTRRSRLTKEGFVAALLKAFPEAKDRKPGKRGESRTRIISGLAAPLL